MPGLAPPFVALSLLASLGTPSAPPQHVIGGDPSPMCAWPSTVAVGGCSGTLIHPEVVVYAAHCGSEIPLVRFGEVAAGQGREVAVDRCVVNPLHAANGFQREDDWAFCHLAEPVLDVPIIPPLMGCETTLLTPGRLVTLVGFGVDEDGVSGIKQEGEAVFHWITEEGAALIGDGTVGSCFGDSGGPAFIQMPDGSWRVFGIVSGGAECGYSTWFATVHTAIPMIEEELGIDVTPCHYTHGGWNPSPACTGFPTEPFDGEGKTWEDGCAGGPVSEAAATCGPAYDERGDLTGPQVAIVSPEYGDTYVSDDDGQVTITIDAEASDLPSGVVSVALAVNGVVPEGALDLEPPWQWADARFPSGVWELTVIATDWAGNESISEVVAIGVDADPPPAPPPPPAGSTGGETTGGGDGSSDDGGTLGGGVDSSSTGDIGSSSSDTATSGDALPPAGPATGLDDDGGCTCSANDSRGDAWGAGLLLLAVFGLRRRRAATVLAVAIGSIGCGDDGSPSLHGRDEPEGTTGSTSSPSGSGPSGSSDPSGSSSTQDLSSSTTEEEDSSSSTGSTSTGGVPACEPGTEDCVCTAEFTCGVDLRCELNTCVACPQGTETCHCFEPEDERGEPTCEGDLLCGGGLCAPPPPCPFTDNGICNEGGACFPGSDVNDCCATREDGICEEMSRGGACPDGTDTFDCCPALEDGTCEEVSAGGACPNGSDAFDCCATQQNGVCEEMSAGGSCPNGSDVFDCCATLQDGTCEEMSAGGMCPNGSDVFDCCATLEDGTCEEVSSGGTCPDGSDVFDCCPTLGNDVCEEMSAGGACPDGSDVVDCALD